MPHSDSSQYQYILVKKATLREVQYKAGHKFVGSTEAFLVNDLDELQKDILKYHPL